MVNVFKVLNPLNILWLGIVVVVLRAGYWFNTPDKLGFAFSEPFARLLVPANIQYPFSPAWNIFLAALIVFVQSLLINFVVNHYNLLGKPTLLPALMYITVAGLFSPFLVLSPTLICNFLIIWMLFKLLNLYKTKDAKSAAFDLGMIVAVGSVIYLPFIYLFLVIWIGLIIFRPIFWREFLAGVVGYVIIFFFLAVYYYLNDRLGAFFEIWKPLTTKFPDSINFNYYNYLMLIPVIVILILCFFKIQQNFFRSYVQIRKSFQLTFILFLITLLSFYIKAGFQLNHFLLAATPVSVFFSYYFLYAKNKWFYEFLYLLLFVSIIYFQFNTF